MPPFLDNPADQGAHRIARAVEALRADYERQGYVTDDQVVRAVHKRKVEAEGLLQVRQALAEAGIAIEDSSSEIRLESVGELAETSGDDAVRRYLVEIGKYRLLRPEDEVTLGRRVQMGKRALDALGRSDFSEHERSELLRLHQIGRDAEQQMISANLRLVVSVAKRYSKTLSLDLLDLIQEGTLGLMRAVERFDYQRGYKFSTYATWWILQGVTRSIADKDRLIRLPVHVIEALRKLQRLKRRLSASLWGAEPEPRELAVHLGWSVEKVRLLLSVAEDAVSIDAPVGDSEESSLGDLLRSSAIPDPEQILADQEAKGHIDAVVDQLGGATAEVIRLRFGIGAPEELTLQEIGDMKGVTRERIRQIEAKGLKLLRRKSGDLRHFWDEGRGTVKGPRPSPMPETTLDGKHDGDPHRSNPGGADDGVLASLFDRLSTRARVILILRYGLDGENGISAEEASARLAISIESLRQTELRALDTLSQTAESFRELLKNNLAIRESLSRQSRASRRATRRQDIRKEAVSAHP